MTEIPADGTPFDDHKLRRVLAQDAIRAGRVPKRRPSRMWGGTGDGASCNVCLMPIAPQTLGYELEFTDGNRGTATHHLHIPCFTAWEAECASENDETGASRKLNGHANGHANGSGRSGSEDAR